MSDIEDQLRAALRRHDPPPGFAERVIENTRRTNEPAAARVHRSLWRPMWRPLWSVGAIAATFTLVSFSLATYQHAREERAARQAQLALRIAAEKLNLAWEGVFKNVKQEDYQ